MLKTKILDHSIQHKVIELVKANPILWDTRIADYKLSERKSARPLYGSSLRTIWIATSVSTCIAFHGCFIVKIYVNGVVCGS